MSNGEGATDQSEFFWDELIGFIGEGSVIPIVGPDLITVQHQGRELQLYQLLAQRLAEKLGVSADDLSAGQELNDVACRFLVQSRSQRGYARLYAALASIMPGDEEIAIPEPLLQLAQIQGFRLYVTTSFDSLLERALSEARFNGKERPDSRAYFHRVRPENDIPQPLDRLRRPLVFYLLGQLSASPTYAVTQEDVLEFMHALQSKELQPPKLFSEFEQRSLLLLGSGMSDWLARFFLRAAKSHRLSSVRETIDYLADDRGRQDADLVVFLRHFATSTEIFEAGSAVEFVAELHRRWKEAHPEPEAETGLDRARRPASASPDAGVVFLSYASEDRSAAEALTRAIEEAGVEVFFDRDDLQGGDEWAARLEREIAGCSLFIPLVSHHTLTGVRREFRSEWALAEKEARKARGEFILPVVIDETGPEELERFESIHWEPCPGGVPKPEFVERIVSLYRQYQKELKGRG